ncbi:hypothetical protein BDZ94DRAFT_1309865 [Collybia nuda]|uniref:Uncharacterized protein n=1 Tax=Collybia nuda TaxID=64659 RepID=A0A9P6CHE8_9AGAR|nr:hypothetical protein BDZ94DRAFT_1309865 [Collybia nuda]
MALPVMTAPGPSPSTTDSTLAENAGNVGAAAALVGTAKEALGAANGMLSKKESSLDLRAPDATFISCTVDRQRQIVAAAAAAKRLIISAHRFTATPGNFISQRFKTWFGTYDEIRAQTVLHNWERMTAANLNTWVYNCDCTINYGSSSNVLGVSKVMVKYQYVPPFGRAIQLSRSDISPDFGVRFNNIAGAKLHSTYNQEETKNLATNNPDQAIDNAYSYVFYADNNPPL